MSNIDKHAQGEKTREAFERWAEQSGALPWGILKKHRNQDGTYPGPHYTYMWHAWNACYEALLDELEAAEKLIAELSHHLQCAHAFIEHTEAFGYEASNGILCCGDAQWNIDASKAALASTGRINGED
ncbi:hypothetical protein [Enterobacter hormaechei]|uniref:hypothetical protein n=1 Tax=Enterobacter hormaechei TaxID=158836 RepID=UPI0011DCF965|nr:hypothetical protein [Enterobacter hormaechei]MCO6618884.1 hypothetical protein [Enterobacter hormaechei]TXT70864.1 hypothetical protein D4N14_23920 [Enterobacter hormaechei]